MERDINFLKSVIKEYKTFGDLHNPDFEDIGKICQSIENLINKNKELRQEVAEHERREGQQNQNMVSALEESLKYSLEIKDLEIKNKELEKMVELMAKYIQALISKYEDDTYTYTSIIDYFKKKASEENG